MPVTRRFLLSVWSLIILAACAEQSEGPTVTRADSSGITIVENRGADQTLDWTLEQLFVLGGADDGPESFYLVRPGLVDADAQGNIYVLDGAAKRVVVFSSSGQFIRSMGRGGEGPGELEAPNTLAVDASGNTYVFDYGKFALVGFGRDGNVLPQIDFQHMPTPSYRHFASFGEGFIVLHRTSSEGRSGRVLGVTGSEVELAMLEMPPSEMTLYESCRIGLNFPPVFSPEIVWDLHGEQVAFADGGTYSIRLWSEGRIKVIIRRDIPVEEATRALAEAEIGEGMTITVGAGDGCLIPSSELVENRGFSSHIPVIEDISYTAEGELWVARSTIGPEPSRVIDVFDADGTYVGTLRDQITMPLLFLPGNRVGVRVTDGLDVDRLVVFRIVPGTVD